MPLPGHGGYLSAKIIRKGWTGSPDDKKQTKRRYKCKNCLKHYVEERKEYFIGQEKIELINRLLPLGGPIERLSLRSISRAVKVSLRWLMSYIKKLYNKVLEVLYFKARMKKKEQGKSYIRLIKSELDEIRAADAVELRWQA